jgi:menaquinone-dependent protoporphyrinogen oxidase
MTAPHVLVAHGSKNGSTAEIAQWIGRTLTEQGITVDVLPASAVHDLSLYTGVVLGAGVYEGRWQHDALHFVGHHHKALELLPLWLFSSGPLDDSASLGEVPAVPGVARIAERLDARDHVTFGGRLAEGARGFLARQILGQGRGGDYRDRAQVRAWALGIAAQTAAAGQPQPS